MADHSARCTDTNANVRRSSNPNVNAGTNTDGTVAMTEKTEGHGIANAETSSNYNISVGTRTNTNMAMTTEQPQGQGVAQAGTSSNPSNNAGSSTNNNIVMMTEPEAQGVANAGTGSNTNINVGTSTNTNMRMLTEQPQGQRVPHGYRFDSTFPYVYENGYRYNGYPSVSEYGYDVYQHVYNYAPHYPYAGPFQQAVALNVVMNRNGQDMHHHPEGNTFPNYYYDYNNLGTYQFQWATPTPQLHYHPYHDRQPQPRQSQLNGSRLDRRRNLAVGAGSLERFQSGNRGGAEVVPDGYNLPGFITRYGNAKFFVMKPYNREHVLCSIKHGVWTSTHKGNLKLSAAYDGASSGEQRVQKGTTSASGSHCPIFLLFSVHKSSHFCGVAEMVGPVDFGATSEFWDWKDKFPVKWHMIKDVPFSQVAHITLESTGNLSIIGSRESQQVEKEKGEEMLNIFKNYHSRTSLLDEIAWPRRVNIVVRGAPSTSPTEQDQHEQQEPEEEEEAATSCRSRNNNTEDTDNNTATVEEETDHNNPRNSKCEESRDTESTVISVTSHSPSNNQKPEEEANIYKGESECEDSHETQTQSTMIIVGSHIIHISVGSQSIASNKNSIKK